MKVIKNDLPDDINRIEIKVFADEHIGDTLSDINRIRKRIEYVENHSNCYAILNGDIMNNATCDSVSDTYSEVIPPMQQLEIVTDLFKPIKDKILCITDGNHESRTYKQDGIQLGKLLAIQLDIADKYTPTAALLFVRFGHDVRYRRKACYTIYVNHGRGGGRKIGSKANRLVEMANIVDSDVYLHAHTHEPMIVKQDHYRVSYSNSAIHKITKLFVNTASNLDYGGYGEIGEFPVPSIDSPTIYLYSGKHRCEAQI